MVQNNRPYAPQRGKLQQDIYAWAMEKGWWDEPRDFLHLAALVHSEISEAVEAWREDKRLAWISEEGKPEGYMVELADAIIRIMDLAENEGIDILHLVEEKMKYNQTRPYRHGGKRA